MTSRSIRLTPYFSIAALVGLLLAVIATAPFSASRNPASRKAPLPLSVIGKYLSSLTAEQPATGRGSQPYDPIHHADSHQLFADTDAAQILEHVSVPNGAVMVISAPSGTPDMGGPPQYTAVTQRVDDHRIWIVGESTGSVLSWFGAHPPDGATLTGRGSFDQWEVQKLAYDTFDLPPVGQVLASRQISVSVARDPAGQAVLRVDAQVVWYPNRPSQSMVPSGTAHVVVTDHPQGPQGTPLQPDSRTSSDPRLINGIATIVNSLPEATSGFASCPAFSGDVYTLVFESDTGVPLATVKQDADSCFGAGISVEDTRTSVALMDPDQLLLKALEAFLPPPPNSLSGLG